MITNDHVSWYHLIWKNKKYNLKIDKKWPCKLIQFTLKNKKCNLKNDKKWSCFAGFTVILHKYSVALIEIYTINYIIGRAIWDKFSECIFENFENFKIFKTHDYPKNRQNQTCGY